MKVKAQLKYLRIAPRKVRLITDLIRGKKVTEAKNLLEFSLKRGAKPLKKLLDSAITSAANNFQITAEGLRIAEITVSQGPTLKRWRARARGRAAPIKKKTSHITLILEGETLPRRVSAKQERSKKEKMLKKRIKPKPPVKRPSKEAAFPQPKVPQPSTKERFQRKAF